MVWLYGLVLVVHISQLSLLEHGMLSLITTHPPAELYTERSTTSMESHQLIIPNTKT